MQKDKRLDGLTTYIPNMCWETYQGRSVNVLCLFTVQNLHGFRKDCIWIQVPLHTSYDWGKILINFLICEKILLESSITQLGFLSRLEIMSRKPLAQCIAHYRSIISGNYYCFLPPSKPQGNLMKVLRAMDKNFEAIHLLVRRWMTKYHNLPINSYRYYDHTGHNSQNLVTL